MPDWLRCQKTLKCRYQNVTVLKTSFFALLFHFFYAYIVHLSLLSSLNRLDKPHTSFPPNIQAHTMSNQILKRPSNKRSGQTVDFPMFTAWTEVTPVGGTRWSDLLRCRKGGKKIMHVSHIVIRRRKGGREETCEANGVPHPLGRSVGEYFLQSFTGSVYILHTHRSALNWLWTCPVSFLIQTAVRGGRVCCLH